MKTTLELPDELLIEANATAARQCITLKQLFTRALQRELSPLTKLAEKSHFTVDEYGWPILNRDLESGIVVTQDLVDRIREEEATPA